MQKAKLYFFLLLFLLIAYSAWATVSEYSFTSTLGTFTEITGGTVLGTATNDNEVFNALPLGFTFNYNGVDYTEVSVACNGFIAMGPAAVTSNQPISNANSSNNVVAAIGRDIKSRDTGELMYLSSGTAPNRMFTVQWKHWRRSVTATANDDVTFQIQLQENGNKVVFVYGPFTAVTSTTNQAIQVGLRGDSNADFNNRATTTDWSATTAGTANNNFCVLSASVFPASGLSFTFTAPVAGEPPLPASNPVPANNAINVSIYSNLSWVAGGGTVEGYKVYLGTDNPPTSLVNGTTQTDSSYNPEDFTYNTVYYWKIVPYNSFGDALNCPVWSFTTLADPTITAFPYTQNFDALTPPTLPLGWNAINVNGDAYTWETYAGNAQSNPNCARIRFNNTAPMNDWLLMPPLQLTQDVYYKVRFYYRGGDVTAAEKLALFWGMAPDPTALTNQIWVNENINNVSYALGEGIIQAPSTGVFHFGFKAYSPEDLFYIFLDTVNVSIWVEALNPPRNLTATVDNHDVHLAWIAPLESRALLGYKVYRNNTLLATIDNPDSLAYHETGIASGLYSYGVTAFYTSGESVPAGPVLADVDPVILPPANLTATVLERDVTLNWTNPEGNWITWCNMTTGNSVGTNAAAVFDVAHRWPQEDLAPFAGRSLSRIEFVPFFANCTYTIKIWTGGSATDAGTLVHSQVVPSVVLNEWNRVFLTAIIPIPATGDLYYGYEVNTTGGYPAGADDGPPIEGKGNMMYFGGQWTTLSVIAPTLTYNWNIRAFAQFGTPPAGEQMLPPDLTEYMLDVNSLSSQRHQSCPAPRNVTGYKVYRDSILLSTINSEEINTYTDAGLANATYLYSVTSVSPTGEGLPATVEVVVNFQLAEMFFEDGFEDYPDFATTFAPWTLRDVDLSATYGITDVTFPGSGGPMSFIIFNPATTTPPITDLVPHGGAKMAGSFAATTPPNNDFIVTPRVQLGTNSSIKFFARSHTAQYGLERFRVGVSVLPTVIPGGFTYVTGPDYIEAPVTWTEYVYDLSAWDNQRVYVGIRCVSNDAFVFWLDDVSLHSDGGTDADDPVVPALVNALQGNYPNPFNPETTIRFSTAQSGRVKIDVYNIKGQLVKQLLNENLPSGKHSVIFNGKDAHGRPVASGVYFYRMQAGNFKASGRMIMMK